MAKKKAPPVVEEKDVDLDDLDNLDDLGDEAEEDEEEEEEEEETEDEDEEEDDAEEETEDEDEDEEDEDVEEEEEEEEKPKKKAKKDKKEKAAKERKFDVPEGALTTKELGTELGISPRSLRVILRAKFYPDNAFTRYYWMEGEPILQKIRDYIRSGRAVSDNPKKDKKAVAKTKVVDVIPKEQPEKKQGKKHKKGKKGKK